MRESKETFRQLFDVAAVPLCFVNKEGVLVDFNARFVKTFGYTHEDVPTLQEWWQLAYPDPDYRRWVVETWEAAVRRSIEEKTDIEPFEHRVTCKNGEVRTVVISGTSLGDDFLATFFDITERKRAEEEIKTINEELVAINRTIASITGASSIHEIFEKVMDEAWSIAGLEGGTICMVTSQNTLQLAAHRKTSEATIRDLTANEIKIGDCLCGECARSHKPLILRDRAAVLAFATREAMRGEDIRFHAAFPLVTGGECLGVLCVFTRTDKRPQERRLKLLETVTAQIALAVQNAGLLEESLRNTAVMEEKVKERTAELQKRSPKLNE